ncbi:MAG: hypothetical protein HKO62_10750 [Gammaproteobacteria bacterium]|nr:hypothetical protein [Gammaproteobacteria bacterium]NNM01219.1 hypothetical protein [Gammaproteobacteria bacterium]
MAVAVALLSAGAAADQNAPELDTLFIDLANAESARAAALIEDKIWKTWLTGPTEEDSALLIRVLDAMSARDYGTALEHLDTLHTRAPGFAEAWNQRAIVLFLMQDFDGSLAAIDRTLALEPRHFGALAGGGQCYLQLGQPRQALGAFREALNIHPWMHGLQGQVEMLKRALEKQSQPREVRNHLPAAPYRNVIRTVTAVPFAPDSMLRLPL